MRRDGLRRFCEQCSKHVHDLGAMTESEARAWLHAAQGQEVCVRYRMDADGALRFATPAVSAGRGAAMLVLTAGLLAACAGWDAPESMSPPDVELCRDPAGYAIDCRDAEPTIPDELAPLEHEPAIEGIEGIEGEVQGGIEGGVEGAVMGAMVAEAAAGGPPSCPLPPPIPESVEPAELVGAIRVVETIELTESDDTMAADRTRVRQQRRAERRERRRQRHRR